MHNHRSMCGGNVNNVINHMHKKNYENACLRMAIAYKKDNT